MNSEPIPAAKLEPNPETVECVWYGHRMLKHYLVDIHGGGKRCAHCKNEFLVSEPIPAVDYEAEEGEHFIGTEELNCPRPCPICGYAKWNGQSGHPYGGRRTPPKTLICLGRPVGSKLPQPTAAPSSGGEKIKPCPFCDGAPESGEISASDETGEHVGYFYIECKHPVRWSNAEVFCGVHADSMELAITKWNTRGVK